MSRVAVIGGGASGMMAAIAAAKKGHNVTLYEKNEKLGKKIYITGKGRCNITNASHMDKVLENVVTNPRFLYSSFDRFTNEDAIRFFEQANCPVKIERGNRVFPKSDHSSDVIRALAEEMKRWSVRVFLNTAIMDLVIVDGIVQGVIRKNGQVEEYDACIVATGGLSYSSTGSTGDGYRMAREAGHLVTSLMPALVSIHLQGDDYQELMGLSLKNISVKFCVNQVLSELPANLKKKIKTGAVLHEEFGEMLFTHFGVSGPVILSASSYLSNLLAYCRVTLYVDLKPGLSEEQLDSRILRDFEENSKKQFKNSMNQLLPQKIIGIIINRSGILEDKQVNTITKEERMKLIQSMKHLSFEVKSLGGYNEAVITKGGVDVKEVNPSTMESKLIKGLYFCGEILNVDALTGGYNLQIAWSTGYTAGDSVE